jgi:hypothetical protein
MALCLHAFGHAKLELQGELHLGCFDQASPSTHHVSLRRNEKQADIQIVTST